MDPACAGEDLSVTADAHNWIHATGGSDYQYDAAGNMTFNATPPTQTYSYDQENRLTGAAGYAYTYDADGNRVRKSSGNTGTLYWYMTPGIVGESDLSGNLNDEYVFFGGERVARKSTNGVIYYFSDHLKTASVISDSAGNIKSESDFYPWGGELQFVNNDSNHYKFTGKERDSETQLDYFGARHYSNGLGRWVSADWSPTPTPVPYADFGDPQSLNLYGFVGGNPASKADPDGHCCEVEEEIVNLIVQHPVAAAAVVSVAEKIPGAVVKAAEVGAEGSVSTVGVILFVLTASQKTASAKKDEQQPQTATGGNGAKNGGNNTTAVSPGPDGMKSGSSKPDGAGKPFNKATKDGARAESGDKCVFCGKHTTREPGPDQSNIDQSAVIYGTGARRTREVYF
jgi:RHS repeat-associated protein